MMINKARINDIINNKWGNGLYNGVVVDNADPLQRFRVRVRIIELNDGIPKTKLPWYIVKQPVSNTPNAQGKIPPVGSNVMVEFPTNDIYNGLISWEMVSKPPFI
jgi:hypothetical protein